MPETPILWRPSKQRRERSALFRFMTERGVDGYDALYRWSIEDAPEFWAALARFCEVEFSAPPRAVCEQPGDMTTARWFPGATLSFAAHLLRHRGERAALVFRGEDGRRRELSCDQLRAQVAACAAGLRQVGVRAGDRVAGLLPNCPEAVVGMLATASLGAIWSSCSPDFGVSGVVDRFGQIQPRVLICADGYRYGGKRCASLPAVREVLARIDAVQATVVVPFLGEPLALKGLPGGVAWGDFLVEGSPLEFAALPFEHPLYVMYSSGTTGKPKCMLHGQGGTLLQHLKEHRLHCDVGPGDRIFYFTTCGWMMWNWLVSALAVGATVVLYDGSPFAGDPLALWRMAAEERLTVFGTSARYLSALEKAGVRPREEVDLSALRTVLSTGSVLAPESFDYVYEAIGADLQLSSISGGTDILGCFAGGNPLLPVRRGELQCRGLGMAVEVYDAEGRAVVGQRGELVCTRAFPSMPLGFYGDPDGSRYRAAYFGRFPGVWAHGDFAELTPGGGVVIHGRSDAVLNPGGVRIGTAELTRQVETLDAVLESLAIGQRWEGDERVVLFVVLREGLTLDEELRGRIRAVIREHTTPRHVPARIVAVPELPRTLSGKLVELAVRAVVHGEAVHNADALANPEALEHFRDLPELAR
ncbi:MAG: acetoacetate--CoA ligase [Planctomycetes bacterium]|nr:acetoacetate--CoA ligase [Planctomycetota bacterium]